MTYIRNSYCILYNMNFIYISHHFTAWEDMNSIKLTSLPLCGFTAQLVEHRTGIAEVTGSNPVEALIFFRLLPSNCLNWKVYFDDHSSLSSTTAEHYEFHIHFTNIQLVSCSSLRRMEYHRNVFCFRFSMFRCNCQHITAGSPFSALHLS